MGGVYTGASTVELPSLYETLSGAEGGISCQDGISFDGIGKDLHGSSTDSAESKDYGLRHCHHSNADRS